MNIPVTGGDPRSTFRYEAILPQYIDATMLSSFRRCERRFYDEFVLGLRTHEDSIHLHAGACYAVAQEYFHRRFHEEGKNYEDSKLHALNAYTRRWGNMEPPPNVHKTYDSVWTSFIQYLDRYNPLVDYVQPYYVEGKPTYEFTFAVPLDGPGFPRHPSGDPFLWSGRFDMLGTYHGRPCVKDDKTTGQAGVNWAEQFDLRTQFIGYVFACQHSGIPLDTVVVRGAVIQKTNPRQLEAVKVYPPFLVERWLETLRTDLWRIVRAWEEKYWKYDLADACTTYGICPFARVCGTRNASPEEHQAQYWVKRWNPLQRDPTADKVVENA